MSNISIVNLSAYTIPVIQENKKNIYIEYGSDNNYYQYLIDNGLTKEDYDIESYLRYLRHRNRPQENLEEYNKQTGIMTVNKQLEDIVAFFKKLFPPEKKPLLKDVSNIQDNIRDIESKLSQINLTQPIIQKLLMLLSAVAGLYIFGWFFGWIIHLIAIATLAIGLWYIISTSKQ
jgi:hypothetical protein